jgi:hypothetical protein
MEEVRRRTAERSALCLALLAAVLACAYLGRIVHRTEWGMDADEAVHAVEALRLYDRFADGDPVGFLRAAWVPERWAPPVNPHVRWYPPVHALCTVPFLALLGRSDFAARVPSVVFLLATVVLFFELGRRLGRGRGSGAASGLCAALLLLAAPNVLTFSAQGLTEPASLFFTFLAFLAYLASLERGHPWGWATLAGLALGVCMLTKYDHGGLFALALGLAEVARHRGRVDRMLRTGPVVLFGLPLAMIVAWFAGADKMDALRDSVSHPFAGSARLVFLDFFLTWIVEYGSSVAMGALAVLALCVGWRRADPAVRALWFWAVLTTLFLGVRSRFHFRYNFVEAPAALLLLGVLLPGWIDAVGRAVSGGGRRAAWIGLAAAGGAAAVVGAWLAVVPGVAFESLRGPFTWLHGLRADHFGMSLEPGAYVDHFATEYRAFARYLGGSVAVLGLGLAILGVGARALARQPRERAFARGLAWTALAVGTVPGAVRLYAGLPAMVEWELECAPEIDALQQRVTTLVGATADPDGPPRTILLGGGWDQLTNNGLRWHVLTRGASDRAYADVEVWGDMIGSLVFPPEPRIRYWAEVLATAGDAPAASGSTVHGLPDVIALVFPDAERFLYHTRMGPEASIYRELTARRGGYERVLSERFEHLQADLELYARAGAVAPPVDDFPDVLAAHGIRPETEGNASRYVVGADGWAMRDESLRHFLRR